MVATAAATLMVVRAATVGHRPQLSAVGTTIRRAELLRDLVIRGDHNLLTRIEDRLNSHLSKEELLAVVMDKRQLKDVGLTTDRPDRKLCSRVYVN